MGVPDVGGGTIFGDVELTNDWTLTLDNMAEDLGYPYLFLRAAPHATTAHRRVSHRRFWAPYRP